MRRAARAAALAGALTAASAPAAALADYPDREVDRPLVVEPGMSEAALTGEWARASRIYDGDARSRALPEGAAQSAVTAMVAGRYGLFRGLEVWFRAPYVVRLGTRGEDPVSGTGRGAFGARYQIQPQPMTFAAVTAGVVLPSTARKLRTAPDGTVFRDHLAVEGAAAFKQVLLDSTAAYGLAGIVFPFANEDDDEAERDPPATFRLAAGSIFQVHDRFYADAGVSYTRTNRDVVSGGIVPRSDQYRVDLRPAAGYQPLPRLDLRAAAALPVAGKNTPQSIEVTGEVRWRF